MERNSLDKRQGDKSYGQRLRLAVTLCGMKLPIFARRYKVSVSSLYSIEKGILPLTLKMATRISHALLQEGCLCSSEWLLYGSGAPPHLSQERGLYLLQPNDVQIIEEFLTPELKVLKEIDLFKSLHPNSIVVAVFDDTMQPFYSPGDYVGGYPVEESQHLINKDCIVFSEQGDQFIRRINTCNPKGSYNMQALNPYTKGKNLVLFDQTVEKVIPIIWHRKKDF